MKFVDYPFATLRQKFPANMLTESGMDLLKKFLTYDPKQRISCDEVIIKSQELNNLTKVESNKKIYHVLDDEIKNHIHSIQILIN